MNTSLASFILEFEFSKKLVESLTKMLGFDATSVFYFLVFAAGAAVVVGFMATIGGFGTYAERKVSADLQLRIGPNRVGPYGLLQLLADGIKMLVKEDISPRTADKFLFYLAPLLCLVGVFATFAVFPFGSSIQFTNLNVGVFYLIAVSSLVGVGVFLGGYASNSKWSMLGGMRGASQIISYEIPVTISIIAITILAGGMSFEKLISAQSGLPHNWFIFHNPFTFLGFFVFFTGALAETNRAPFDLPEAESELVSGYHTEYTGLRFGFFALAEYIEVFIVCGVAASLFLGGYNIPFKLAQGKAISQPIQFLIIFLKTAVLYYIVIWIRWTFPRLRVDQLMSVCWKYLTPMALFNLVGCAVWLVVFDGKSIFDLIFK